MLFMLIYSVILKQQPFSQCLTVIILLITDLSAIAVEPNAVQGINRSLAIGFEAANIECRPLWKPMHLQPILRSTHTMKRSCCNLTKWVVSSFRV
jgi:hypothetical protein